MIDSASEFIRLRYSDDPAEYRRAASEEADLAVWLEVVELHPAARVWVAQNKTVPMEVLTILASDESREVRFMVSKKRKLTPDLLHQLSEDDDESIRLQVALHRNTPLAVLESLSRDEWDVVASAAAERLNES